MKINKTMPPTFPFEKNKLPKGYVLADMGFFDKNGNYKEDWQLIRVYETKKK